MPGRWQEPEDFSAPTWGRAEAQIDDRLPVGHAEDVLEPLLRRADLLSQLLSIGHGRDAREQVG